MRRLLVTCAGVLLLLSASVKTDDDDREELIIRARPQVIAAIADRYGLTLLRTFDQANQNLFLMLCPREDDDDDEFECDDDLIEDIEADPDVESVARNDDLEVPELPGTGASEDDVAGTLEDDAIQDYFGTAVWTQFANQAAATIASTAQAHTVATGTGIVAIIDTGADYTHPVLQPALIPGFDFFTNTITTTSELADLDPTTARILDQSTSAILEQDDVVLVNQSTSAILEQDAAQQLDPAHLPAAFGHGTMVAGLIRLVAPTATIMPLRAFRPDGTSTTFDVLRAIYYAADNGADVINMSFSFPEANSELKRALDYATARGVVAIASAGNTGNRVIVYPAAFPNVIGVASTTNEDTRSAFSNYGADLVTLAAPGEALITSYPGGNYAGVWGTSFSAALVSGATALLKQVDPGIDQAGAEAALSQAQPVDPELGAGRLDLVRALSALEATGGDVALHSDFDGDERTDVSVYRPSTGQWWVLSSRQNFTVGSAVAFGAAGDLPVSGDFDGDGIRDPAVYRPSTGTWFWLKSTSANAQFGFKGWGVQAQGDVPAPGDYDGDGQTDLTVFRPATGTWFILKSSSNNTQALTIGWGQVGDVLVPGDYDGDGRADVAVFRPATGQWFLKRSATNFATSVTVTFGQAGDVPVHGDFDGDGKKDIAVFRPSTGTWFWLRSSTNNTAFGFKGWGVLAQGDVPVPGDYDGDGKTDPTVFRPATGTWFVLKSSTNYTTFAAYGWGNATDIPLGGQR